MANQIIDASVQKEIDNYGNKITTLKDFICAVRQVPGMYIGPIGNKGFLNMIREIYQNSIDQLMVPNTPCNKIYVFYDEKTHQVTVEDNGLGLPFDDMIRIITSQHTSKNYVKKKGEFSSGVNGVGAKIVNALSSSFIAESYNYKGEARRITMEEGYITTKEPVSIPNKEHKQGTKITFFPCEEVLGVLTLEWKTVYHLVKDILSLSPLGSEVNFMAIDSDGVKHSEHIVNKDGIITKLISDVKSPLCKPILFSDDTTGEMKLDIAFVYDSGGKEGPDPNEKVTSFCNMCPTTGGTHVIGSLDGISKWFISYMNNIYLSNQKAKIKTKVTSADIKNGLNVVISAASLEPIFTGQAKEFLSNEEMAVYCKDVVYKNLDLWAKSNPQDLSKLSKYFKDLADLRMKSEGEKAKIATKYEQNSLTGLPAKYAKPTEFNGEFIIVEGDSAGGSAKVGRDERCQGIFPIRGKISSAFEKSYQEFWNNAETQGIARIILDKPYPGKKNINIEEVKWDKIIFMADADVDGSHIASLLLRFFILYMPQLIEAGKVYKALPPLYSIKNGQKLTYFTDQIEFVKYVQKTFMQYNTLTLNNKQLANKDITLLFMINEDYVYEIERLAHTYAVDPKLLEDALYNYYTKASISQIKKSIKKDFRFMNAEQIKDTIMYQGTIKESNLLFMNHRLVNDCQRALDIIQKNSNLHYTMNGSECGLYTIMKTFEQTTPSNIQRYKGLGEMNADQIAISTLRPDSDRTLIRYTLEDAKEELEIIRDFESDRSKLLKFVGNVKRSDLLD